MKHDIINLKEKCQDIKSFCKVYDTYCLLAGSAIAAILVLAVPFILIKF